jgi:ubiquinone/menaquinone biosynthesis C-methylase UbiE
MSKHASRKYHNRVAGKYDAIYDDDYWHFHDEVTWRRVKPRLPRDLSSRCLDLGCGTGKWGLKLLKSGFHTTFIDHAPAMIGKVQEKLDELGKQTKAAAHTADIVDLSLLADGSFALTLAMGDPLSICADPARAAREMFRLCTPGGVVIATADNKLAAIDHFMKRGDMKEFERFIQTGKTRWLTNDVAEQFDLTMFTPSTLRKLFERAGFQVVELVGKTILPVREFRQLLGDGETFRRLVDIEMDLADDPSSAARGSHLQVVAVRPAADAGPGVHSSSSDRGG